MDFALKTDLKLRFFEGLGWGERGGSCQTHLQSMMMNKVKTNDAQVYPWSTMQRIFDWSSPKEVFTSLKIQGMFDKNQRKLRKGMTFYLKLYLPNTVPSAGKKVCIIQPTKYYGDTCMYPTHEHCIKFPYDINSCQLHLLFFKYLCIQHSLQLQTTQQSILIHSHDFLQFLFTTYHSVHDKQTMNIHMVFGIVLQ